MSWWDSGFSNFANQATQALQKAQKQIDKVLDIKEGDEGSASGAQQDSSGWSWTGVSTSSSNKSALSSSSTSKEESSGDDSFWNAWLPDTGTKTEKKTTTSIIKTSSSPPKLSSSVSAETLSVSEERKSVSKLESMIEGRKKASEKLGLRKSRKKSSTNDEKQVKSQETVTEVVQHQTKDIIETSTSQRESVSESTMSTIEVSTIEVKTFTESSTTDKQHLQLESQNRDDTGQDVIDSVCEVKDVQEIKNDCVHEVKNAEEIKQVQNESLQQTEKEAPVDQPDTKVESQQVHMKQEEEPVQTSLSANAEISVQSGTCTSEVKGNDVEAETAENKVTESVEEKLVISLEDSANLMDEGQSWSQDLTEVDLSIVDEQETKETVQGQNDSSDKDMVHEDKGNIVELETERTSNDIVKDKIYAETDNQKDERDQETVIKSEPAEVENEQIMQEEKQVVQETVPDDTIPTVEPMADSLSDSKSEGSVVEKVQMQMSSESSTTTSEEVDEYNKTLTEEDFKKMAEANAEAENKPVGQESDSDQSKSSPEHTGTGTSSLTSSGYVKNMLEEAMVESLKESDSHSDRSSDKSSDMVRIESGMNSGHTSGDEIDTTTSSDIEIISTPTPNGEYKIMERPFDLSPLRHALSKTVRRGGSPPGHKRSDSGSSAHSNWSKNGDELLSPEGMIHKHHDAESSHMLGAVGGPDSSTNNPLETEKLLKDDSGTNKPLQPIAEKIEPLDQSERTLHVPPQIHQKLAEMAEVIEHRERKLVELSKQNIDLQESNSILRNQLQQSEEAREAEMSDLNEITNEFTERVSESEKKLNQVLREKEAVKKQLEQARNELYKTTDVTTSAEKLLREKDQQIAELMEEGEKLMKQQLQTNNILKKLRAKEKESDSTNKSQKEKLQKQKTELEHLQKVLEAKEELEKNQIEAINQLNNAVKKQEMEINRLKSDLEDAQEKNRSIQVILDNSYKEMAELHKANAAKNSEAQQVALSAEMQAREELRLALERQQVQSKQDQEALVTQIEDLRLSITRMEKESGRREDVLRQEISDLQQRLQEAEGRNQELTQSISAATKPLLRQIENLQSTYTAQTSSYEKVEMNLTDRLAEAQGQLAAAVEKERIASEKVIDVSARLTSLESQVSSLRQEKSRLSAELEMERAKAEVLEEAKLTESVQLETKQQNMEKLISELKKEKMLLENQLEMEKMKVEAEKKKLSLAHEQLREKELLLERKSPSPGLGLSRAASVGSESPMNASFTRDEILEKTLMAASANGNKTSLYESLRTTSAASLLENLQSQLKQKEGEIVQLQSEITELEHTRESMARELVNLSTENERLHDQVRDFPEFETKYKEMDSRYQALLQMYGEKVEETEELRLDLQDVKDMYKAQINELLNSR